MTIDLKNNIAQQNSDPAVMGLEAYKAGTPEKDNPFDQADRAHMDWQLGWEMGMLRYSPGNVADKLQVCTARPVGESDTHQHSS